MPQDAVDACHPMHFGAGRTNHTSYKHLIITNNMSTSHQLGHQILNKESSLQNLKKTPSQSFPTNQESVEIGRAHV